MANVDKSCQIAKKCPKVYKSDQKLPIDAEICQQVVKVARGKKFQTFPSDQWGNACRSKP